MTTINFKEIEAKALEALMIQKDFDDNPMITVLRGCDDDPDMIWGTFYSEGDETKPSTIACYKLSNNDELVRF